MAAKDKKAGVTENNRNILEYFSQSVPDSQGENEENSKRPRGEVKRRVLARPSASISSSLLMESDECNENVSATAGEEGVVATAAEDQDTFTAAADETVLTTAEDQNTLAADDNTLLTTDRSIGYENNTICSLQVDEHTQPQTYSRIISSYLDEAPLELGSESADPDAQPHEERYEFLIDVKDKNGVRRGEEGYDCTTLHIPSKYYNKFTPFEKQFWDIKSQHYDTVVFFKKGKFYELYEDDAVLASKLFDLRVADRVNMKMAGVPESSYESWAAKFVAHGYKIGRVDQSENAMGKKIREQNGKKDKIINRELKEIVTVGTAYNLEYTGTCFPFYLAVLIQHEKCNAKECTGPMHFSILLYDASINKIFANSFCDSYDCSQLKTVFVQNDIKELITSTKIQLRREVIIHAPDSTEVVSDKRDRFDLDEEYLCFTYLHNFMKALHREHTLESAVISNSKDGSDFMSLDGSTLVNLDILYNSYDNTETHSLFNSINYCTTPFGQRLLRKWIVSPLRNIQMVTDRRKLAEVLSGGNSELTQGLKSLGDIERYYGKLGGCNPSFKDLRSFINSLERVCPVLDILKQILPQSHQAINETHRNAVHAVLEQFKSTYVLSETDVLPGNENEELFILNRKQDRIHDKLRDFLNKLKEATGYSDLCYKSIGKEVYQVETSSSHSMPAGFYLVSSTKAQKRYYSSALKSIINEYEEGEERIFQSKGSILRRAIDSLKTFSFDLHRAIDYLASIDCLVSFSIFNRQVATAAPEFGERLELVDFTNPVYPDYIKNTFSPKHGITLVTGPNMGGKSTFLRSICLNIILAQMGMNVMCASMTLPMFDRIFTRIGASDSLARGESTFMVEMNEASKILNQSTRQSFVIMDELGRGTSTRDGEAIARAVLDYLQTIGCTCLFSTHYHKLVEEYDGADKAYVKCKLEKEDITFLYKVQEGVSGDSYGLYVARMAGIPEEIVTKAFKIRKEISGGLQ